MLTKVACFQSPSQYIILEFYIDTSVTSTSQVCAFTRLLLVIVGN